MRRVSLIIFLFCSLQILAQNEFITTWKTDNVGTSNSTSINIPVYAANAYNYDVDWNNDGVFDQFGITGSVTHDFGTPGIYTIRIQGTFPSIHFNGTGDMLKIINIDQWGAIVWKTMFNAFLGCQNLTCTATDVPDLSTASTMNGAFYNATIFNGDLSAWDVSNIGSMNYAFGLTSNFNSDLSNWDVSGVTSMNGTFWESTIFNSDISNWNVANVTNMEGMFHNASSFNSDISSWNVSNVTNMLSMFEGATSFDQNIGNWNMSSVSNVTDMFLGAALSTSNYDSLLIGWSSQILQPGLNFNGGNSMYCIATTERAAIISNYGWTISDAGLSCPASDFITTWKTDNPGTSNATSITIPTNPSFVYNYDVDWDNDGTFDQFGITGDITHDFGSAGTYTIGIRGQFPSIFFNNTGDKDKILDIIQWGTINWSTMASAFYGCTNLVSSATDSPDLTNVSNMVQMFRQAANFTGDLSNWNVSTINNMMLSFYGTSNFNSNLSSWNVSNVTNFSFMFNGATSFTSDLSNWDMSSAIDLSYMFATATSFNSNIGNWNVSNVTNMFQMFENAISFDQNLGNWNMSSVTNVSNMFLGTALSTSNYDSLLIGWSSQILQPGLNFHAGNSMYCLAATERAAIIASYGWTISDAGLNCPASNFITTWKTDNPGTSNATSITIPTNPSFVYNYDVDWDNDGTFDQFGITGDITHDFGSAGTYTIGIRGQFPSIFFNNTGDKDKILDIVQWGTINWSTMEFAFNGCTNLVSTATDTPDLTNVLSMQAMFSNAANFIGDLSSWDVSNVTNMRSVFFNAANFNSDLSNWNVSSVTDMFLMFRGATIFTSDLSGWNVSSVTDMQAMFRNAASFNSDLSTWNVSNVTMMMYMFNGAVNFNSDISTWNVGNVTAMNFMFAGATSFDQNLGNWNMTAVNNVTSMFAGATLSNANYDSLLIGWASQSLQPNLNFDGGNSMYCIADPERTFIISNFGWTIVDGGQSASNNPYFEYFLACEGEQLIPSFVFTAGGTFSFNPPPFDGAAINSSTGEITNYTAGATYAVQYETSGACPASYNDIVGSSISPTVALANDTTLMSGNSIILSNLITSQQNKLTASDGAAGDQFGYAIAVDGNNAVIGAWQDDDKGAESGAAYVYNFNGTSWVEVQKLTANDGGAGDAFGSTVSISNNTIVISARADDDKGLDAGAVYIYKFNGASWLQTEKLTASDGVGGERFGWDVSIHKNLLAVGTPRDNAVGLNTGAVYIFKYNGSNWEETDKLIASDATGGYYFGEAVSLYDDLLLVGSKNHSSSQGAVYAYYFDAVFWNEIQIITASDGAAGDLFGRSIDIDKQVAIIGARGDADNGADAGSAYILDFDGFSWNEINKVLASDGVAGDRFGTTVAINQSIAAVGSYRDDDNGTESGSVYIYEFSGPVWTEKEKILAFDGAANDYFGYEVDISNSQIFQGAQYNGNQGAVYVNDFPLTYNWSTGGTTDSISITVNTDTSVYMIGVNGLGCLDTDTINVALQQPISTNIINCSIVTGYISSTININSIYPGNFGDYNPYLDCSSGCDSATITNLPSMPDTIFYEVCGQANLTGPVTCDTVMYINPKIDASFDLVDFCNGTSNSATNIATPGGTFSFHVNPFDGTSLNAGTGALSGYTAGSAYTIEYNTGGVCPTVSMKTVYIGDYPSLDLGNDTTVTKGTSLIIQNKLSPTQFKLLASDGSADDQFGFATSKEGNLAVIGSRFDDDNGNNSGSAYVFVFNGSNWVQTQKLLASNGATSDNYGQFVKIANGKIFVGARNALGNRGAVYVYTFDGSSWVEDQIITAFDGVSGDKYGSIFDVHQNLMCIGAWFDNGVGSSYFYRFNGENWVLINKSFASIAASSNYFGGQIALHNDKAIIGSRRSNDMGTNAGAAFFFQYNGMYWDEQQVLYASNIAAEDNFGGRVDLFENTAVISSNLNDAMGVDGGTAYVFEYNGSTFNETQILNPSIGQAGDRFGKSITLFKNRLVIGAHRGDIVGNDAGYATDYIYDGTNWIEARTITAFDADTLEEFASWASLNHEHAIIAKVEDNTNGSASGSAYIQLMSSTHLWDNGTGLDSISATINTDTSFFVEITSPIGCVSTDTINILLDCISPNTPTISASTNTLCVGDSSVLSIAATDSLNSASNWYWYHNQGALTLIDSGSTITVFPIDTLEYFVRGEGGCVTPGDFSSHIISVTPPVTASLGNDTTICKSATELTLTVNTIAPSGTWTTTGVGEFTDSTTTTTNYIPAPNDSSGITIYFSTDNVGNCGIANDTIMLSFDYPPIVFAGEDTVISQGESVQLMGEVAAESFEWNNEETLSDIYAINPFATPDESTPYILIASNGNCEVSDTILVEVDIPIFEIRNIITPNDDGKNDFWTITNPSAISGCNVVVINRWGNVVYQNDNGYNNDWDATHNGVKLPDDQYFYIIQCNDKEYKGSINILNSNR